MSYLPMSGLVLAFKNYRFDLGVFGSRVEWIGKLPVPVPIRRRLADHRNTILYNLLNLITSQGLAIVVAVIISELTGRIFKKITQSVIFLPYFISWVIVGTFVFTSLTMRPAY